MATMQGEHRSSEIVRTVVGGVLFVFWFVLTVLWVYSLGHALAHGAVSPLVKAIFALMLMLLLAVMEGLEVAVIDRWRKLYPDRSETDRAGWLAARQLFVALIVTAATILVEPEFVPIPFSTASIPPGSVLLKAFTITWNTLTVLWFMQIVPKHMASINPDRYLGHTRSIFFPVVQVVHHLGVAQPAETVARLVEKALDWHAPDEPVDGQFESMGAPRGESIASAWAPLVSAGSSPRGRSRRDDPAGPEA